jgi:hypothetical protein
MIAGSPSQPKRRESRAKKTAAQGGRFSWNLQLRSMTLGGVLGCIFRLVGSIFRCVSGVVGGISRVGSCIFRSVNSATGWGSRRRRGASSLLSLVGSLAGCISSSLGLISSLGRLRGRGRGCSLLRRVSSLLSSVSRLLSVLRGILRAIAAGRQQRDKRGGE